MLTDFLRNLWIKMFGTTEWLGLNIGFWASMTAVALLVAVMITVFWSVKPKKNIGGAELENGRDKEKEEPVLNAGINKKYPHRNCALPKRTRKSEYENKDI